MATIVSSRPDAEAGRFMPLPRHLTQSQLADIHALPAHASAPTPTTEAHRPARIYTAPQRFAAEIANIFHRTPVPVLPSAALPDPGSFLPYAMLMPQPLAGAKAEDMFRRSWDFQDEIFMEDFSAGVLQQEALASGVLETVHYGGMEAPIGPFHDRVERHLPIDLR